MKLSRKIGILSGVVIAALVAWFAIIEKRSSCSAPENVLLITVDTLRSDHLGCYGYKRIKTPNIDGLAERGTMFKNAISQVPLTLPSHCSLFTSTYPQFNNVRDNGSYRLGQSAVTLAERMQENGYATAAFVSTFVLDSKFGLDQGFETYDDRMQHKSGKRIIEHMEAERTADKVTDAAVSWLRDKKTAKNFLWVHYFDPHAVYNPPAPYREIYKDNPYDGEIAFTDENIGVLLAALKELKLDEKTLIIFAADHGEGLGEHEEFGHSVFLYDTTLKVPLIFSCPGLITEGKIIEGQVRLIDVMPTILDFLQVERNKEIQGESLIGLMKGRIKSLNLPAYSESLYAKLRYNWSALQSFRTAEWKYIKSPEPELYNTKNDPQELVNLAGSRMDVVKELDNRLEIFLTATSSSGEAAATAEMDEETRRKLMSLGYIGGDAAPGSEDPVPRKLIQVMEKMNLSARLANEGLIDKAIEGFREVVKIDPKNTEAYINLAQCYAGLGKYDEAITHFEIAASFKPDNPEIINDIGTCYTEKMDFNKALDQLNKAIELDAEFTQAYYNRGLVHRKLGNWQHAIEDYDKAIELDAEFAKAYSNRGGVYEKSGNYQRAIEDYDKAIELDPKSAEVYYNRGVVYQRSGNHQQAIKDYHNVIELKPRFKPAYYNRGLAYDKSGNHQQAIGDYIKAIELDPQFALAYVRLAKDYEKQEQYEAAIEAWKKVSEIGPQQHEAQKNLTRLRTLTHQ